MIRDIGFLVFPDFQILDLTGPLAVFELADREAAETAYRLRVLSTTGGLVASSSGLAVATTAADDMALDSLIVVGGQGTRAVRLDPEVPRAAARLAGSARRIASVCTGAFILAAAGLLEGRCATTHWAAAPALQRVCRTARVEPDRIFVQDGPVWTSAGVTAGIDLALALVEEDLGIAISRTVAHDLVVYHRRPGGQTQFSTLLDLDPPSDRIKRSLAYARDHLAEPLTVETLAEVACLSPRQFGRAFLAETGQTPAKAIERLRAEAARPRIEAGREPVEQIARDVGFGDAERLRRTCLRLFGQPPQALRRVARAAGQPPASTAAAASANT
jgi:transcriptional regulator GlxA family with amidase domain